MSFVQEMIAWLGGVDSASWLVVMVIAVAAGCGWQGRIKP